MHSPFFADRPERLELIGLVYVGSLEIGFKIDLNLKLNLIRAQLRATFRNNNSLYKTFFK